MRKKLLITYVIIILMAVGISAISFWTKGYGYINKQSENYYLMQAEILRDTLESLDNIDTGVIEEFLERGSSKYNIRITIINEDGSVLADSSSNKKLENHATREEVIGALEGKNVSVTRYSKTMKQTYLYSAVPINTGDLNGVLRVSVPLSYLKTLDNKLVNSITISILICLLIAIVVAIYFAKVLSKPIDEISKAAEEISNGNYSIKIYTRETDQIGQMAQAFNVMTTNLKATMKKLTRKNMELEAILSSMNSGVVAIDNTNAILFHNEAFADIIEESNKNFVGKSLYNVIRNAIIFDAIDTVQNGEESVVKEGYLNLGKDKLLRVTATQIIKENHHCAGVLIILEDITEFKKLERIRSDFVSNVTHELKTPLTSIRGFIDTLKEGAIKDEAVAKKFIDIIDIEAERLSNLIQDILLLSEIESKVDYDVADCDVNEVVRSVIELLQPKLTDKVSLEFTPDTTIRPITCNANRIKQLLINLLDNALKYTEEGRVQVDCMDNGENLVIRVSDTGIGIEEKYLSRIFERFYRVDKGRSRKKGGTGLGLSIVKHIVELYNGKIHVESQVSVGTVFEISIPYQQ